MTSFVGGNVGSWRVLRVDHVIGVPLAWISRLEVTEQEAQPPPGNWVLRGVTAFDRYVTRAERSLLEARQESLGRFFFSSRRRHTRFDCDWSSDVCSSD